MFKKKKSYFRKPNHSAQVIYYIFINCRELQRLQCTRVRHPACDDELIPRYKLYGIEVHNGNIIQKSGRI